MAIVKPDLSQQWASDGDKIAPSGAKIQAGWGPEIPPYQWENFIQHRQDEMLAYLNERGIPEWDNRTDYLADGKSYVQGSDGIVYKSVAASGPSTAVQDPTSDTTQTYWVIAFVEGGTITAVTASQTLTSSNIGTVIITASSNITVTLPDSSATKDREILLQRRDITSNTVQIVGSGADTIMLDTTTEPAGQNATELLFAGDFLRLRSDGAGKWWCVGQAQLPAEFATGFIQYLSVGSYTFQAPPVLRSGRRHAKVTVTGGGGAGGRNNTSSGAGGGAGATGISNISLAGVESVPVTVGDRGAPSGSGSAAGGGGTSSFGGYLSATGGGGATSAGQGGMGGDTAPGASFVIPGGGGQSRCVYAEGSTTIYVGGMGGSSYWGGAGGGVGTSSGTLGRDGSVGGGGSGASLSNTPGRGGAGAVIIEW